MCPFTIVIFIYKSKIKCFEVQKKFRIKNVIAWEKIHVDYKILKGYEASSFRFIKFTVPTANSLIFMLFYLCPKKMSDNENKLP
jgi:hypothetical protein